MKIFRFLFRILAGLILLIITFLILATIVALLTNYKPPERSVLEQMGVSKKEWINRDTLTLLSWNIGYGGLGEKMDFFYDGGEGVRPSKKYYRDSFDSIVNLIRKADSLDFILLQEVDKKARRSYRENQVKILQNALSGYQSVFAKNYDVWFVPVPVNNPMGRVVAGLVNFSRYDAISSERVSFPGNFAFPKNLFMLDRCFIIQRFATDNDKILVLINTHNSAFDDGHLRKEQMRMLKQTALKAYQKGYYVVIGGDWNQNPPDYKPEQIITGDRAEKNELGNLANDFMPGNWSWAYGERTPSNRWVDIPYRKGKTKTTTVDYFLLSPNVSLIEVENLDFGFAHSDHNPVFLKIKLQED